VEGKEQRETLITRILRMLFEVFPSERQGSGFTSVHTWKNFQWYPQNPRYPRYPRFPLLLAPNHHVDASARAHAPGHWVHAAGRSPVNL
jgi:hypothetical protein